MTYDGLWNLVLFWPKRSWSLNQNKSLGGFGFFCILLFGSFLEHDLICCSHIILSYWCQQWFFDFVIGSPRSPWTLPPRGSWKYHGELNRKIMKHHQRPFQHSLGFQLLGFVWFCEQPEGKALTAQALLHMPQAPLMERGNGSINMAEPELLVINRKSSVWKKRFLYPENWSEFCVRPRP